MISNILVFDKDKNLLNKVKKTLNYDPNFLFYHFTNKNEIKNVLNEQEFELILINYDLPEKKKHLLHLTEFNIPIIALSDNFNKLDSLNSLLNGAVSYISSDLFEKNLKSIIIINIEKYLTNKFLHDAKFKYYKLFETINDAILIIKKYNLKIIEANIATTFLIGYSRSDLIHLKLETLFKNLNIKMLDNDSIIKTIIYDIDKNEIPVEISISNLDDRFIMLIRDITEREEKTKELLLQEKLHKKMIEETWEELAIGLNHENSSALSAAQNAIRFGLKTINKFKECKKNDLLLKKMLKILKISIDRIEYNSKYFSNIAKLRSITNPVIVNLNDLIEKILLSIGISYWNNYNVKIIKNIKVNINVEAIPNEILQILDNLIKNAIKACYEKEIFLKNIKDYFYHFGLYQFYQKREYEKDSLIEIKLSKMNIPTNDNFELLIIDNGIGINPKNIRNIFNKGAGEFKKGSKFGLYQVQKYCDTNNLAIQVSSKNEKTVFNIIGEIITWSKNGK